MSSVPAPTPTEPSGAEQRASWLELFFGKVAGKATHRRAMILAMGCIAVMAAVIPASYGYLREGRRRAGRAAVPVGSDG